MGYWVFMVTMEMLIPAVMIGFGTLFIKRSPKDINMFFGYRTLMSMKNKETWVFAHHTCGKLWRVMGWIVFAVSVIVMLCIIGKDIKTIGIVGGVLNGVQVAVLIASIFPVEIALRRTFDKYGNRKY